MFFFIIQFKRVQHCTSLVDSGKVTGVVFDMISKTNVFLLSRNIHWLDFEQQNNARRALIEAVARKQRERGKKLFDSSIVQTRLSLFQLQDDMRASSIAPNLNSSLGLKTSERILFFLCLVNASLNFYNQLWLTAAVCFSSLFDEVFFCFKFHLCIFILANAMYNRKSNRVSYRLKSKYGLKISIKRIRELLLPLGFECYLPNLLNNRARTWAMENLHLIHSSSRAMRCTSAPYAIWQHCV